MGFVSPHVPSTEPVMFCPRMRFICVLVGEVQQRGRRRQSTPKTFPSSTAKLPQETSSGLPPHPEAFSAHPVLICAGR